MTERSWRERLDRQPRRPLIPPSVDRMQSIRMAPWLWLIPLVILALAVMANYPVLKESWGLGGPGTRHAADVTLVRGGWGR